MTIRHFCELSKTLGAERKIEIKGNHIFCDFLISMSNLSPSQVLKTYKGILSDFDDEWREYSQHHIKYGNKVKHIFLKSLGNYSLNLYIEQHFNYKIHPREFRFIRYSKEKFLELSRMEVALLLAKYEELYLYEINIAVLRVLLTYFEVFSIEAITEKPFWNVCISDINEVINIIADSDMSNFKPFFDIIKPGLQILVPHQQRRKTEKIRPTCTEDLLEVIDDNMNQTEKCYAIMEAWNIKSVRSAQRIMQRFGLTNTKKRKGSEPMCMDNTNTIITQLQEEIKQLNSRITEMSAEINEKQGTIDFLQKKVKIYEKQITDNTIIEQIPPHEEKPIKKMADNSTKTFEELQEEFMKSNEILSLVDNIAPRVL